MLHAMPDDPNIIDFERMRAARAVESAAHAENGERKAPPPQRRAAPIPKPKKKPKSDSRARRSGGAPLSARARAPDPDRARARKRRKALREIDRIQMKMQAGGAEALSDWEREFLDSIRDRLAEYGAAFRNPEKGARDDALSFRQTSKLREVRKKSREKDRRQTINLQDGTSDAD